MRGLRHVASRSDFADRANELCTLAGLITSDQLKKLAGSALSPRESEGAWAADERYWFSGTAGLKFGKKENRIIREMWTCMLNALAATVSGEQRPRPEIDKSGGLFGWVSRMVRRDRVEGTATTELERAAGGDVWLAVISIWNALCAALLKNELDLATRSDLESPWRSQLGTTPRETLDSR